jgi:D-3-phosphoglycerate dehydrogenase
LERFKVLVADPLPEGSVNKLREVADVEASYKLPKEELMEKISHINALVVRSETKVTKEILEPARKLQVIARAGVGVDNIDVEAATRKGIVVINSPEGNTLAAAEHTMALMLSLSRKIPQAYQSLRSGKWERSRFVGTELYGKTLGIIGLGKIGKEVAFRAKSFKMKLLGYDPYLKPEQAAEIEVNLNSLEDLLKKSDFVTIHVPLGPQTENLLNSGNLSLMKPGSFLINCARGGIIDEKALYESLKNKQIAGAALDVFAAEPPLNSPLLELENIVVTPHLGASTQEAQERVAFDVIEQLLEIFQGKPARSPVNIPSLSQEKLLMMKPYLILIEKMGSYLSQLCDSPMTEIQLSYQGEIAKEQTSILTTSALKGALQKELGSSVNFVNALYLAKTRGVKIQESKSMTSEHYTNLVSIHMKTSDGGHSVSGSVFENKEGMIVETDGYFLHLGISGHKLLTWHEDKPGIIGKVGTCLGGHGINIAEMQVGRKGAREKAVMILSVDDPVPLEVLKEIQSLEGIEDARIVTL